MPVSPMRASSASYRRDTPCSSWRSLKLVQTRGAAVLEVMGKIVTASVAGTSLATATTPKPGTGHGVPGVRCTTLTCQDAWFATLNPDNAQEEVLRGSHPPRLKQGWFPALNARRA